MLLKKDDPYMYPEQVGTAMIHEDVLRQIIDKVIEKSKNGIPSGDDAQFYARSFMERIQQMVENG